MFFSRDKNKNDSKVKRSWTERIERATARRVKRKYKQDSIPHTVTGRRTYIIPSKFGLVYGIAVFVLLLGSMNYSNSLAFFLTFLLTAVGFIAMHLTNNNLSAIQAEPVYSEAVFAGDPALLKVGLHNQVADHIQAQVTVSNAQLEQRTFSKLDVDRSQKFASLVVPTQKRGYVSLDHYILSTRFPLNLFHAWTVVSQPLRCLVYPSPSENAPEVYGEDANEDSKKTSKRLGQDDFAGLREYQWQDSPQHIAWKTYASRNELMVKQFHESLSQTVLFDFDKLHSLDVEVRLSQLCRLILDADKAKQNYGLQIGNVSIPPNHGDKHRHECLRALALYNSGEDIK